MDYKDRGPAPSEATNTHQYSSPNCILHLTQLASKSPPITNSYNLASVQYDSMSSITTDQWLDAAAHRRTVYGLASTSKVSDKRVEEIVAKVLSFAPSSYNTQPVRISLALGEKHKELWSVIIETAEPVLKSISADLWDKLGPILESHKTAYGSVCQTASGA